MKTRTLAAPLAWLALAALAWATIQHPIALAEPTHFRRDLVFPGYDSANGPLRAVGLCLRWKLVRKVDLENLDAQNATIATGFGMAQVDLELNGSTLATLNFAPFQRVDMLPQFDGALDFGGASGLTRRDRSIGNQLILLDDPAILAQFVDVPSVTITVRGIDLFSMSGPGNVRAESDTAFTLVGMLLYEDA